MKARALRSLIGALEGRIPAEGEWTDVLEIANRGWLGPALYLALRAAGRLDEVPAEARDYLELLHTRNRERNLRLRHQLIEALKALNANGIQPVLLKGAVGLFASPGETLGRRMTSDLDISIDRTERERARAALASLGYAPTANSNEMGRPEDAGTIELHDVPNVRAARYLNGDLRACASPGEVEGAVALVPDTTARALHLIVHDMIKEGDYWRLTIDLRHLNDLAELARSPEALDWDRLRAVLGDRIGRRALEVQARALQSLFGIEPPPGLLTRRPALRHGTRLLACTGGLPGVPLRAFGRLSWGVHRMTDRYVWRGPGDFVQRVRRVLTASRKGPNL